MLPSHLGLVARALRRARAQGFSLIELMITVVIAAVLMSIAIPLYQHQVREARRTDARSALSDLASREERYYALNSVYSSTPGDVGYPAFGTGHPIGGGYYYIDTPTVAVATATSPATFTLTARPIAGKGQDQDSDCASFQVTSTGQDTSLNSGGSDSSPTCWN
jgi:type IV pilus assembly protein PilE